MENATIKAVFNRRKTLNDKGLAPIHVDIYLGGKTKYRKYVHTGILIAPDEWDAKKGCISSSVKDSHLINKMIQDRISAIKEFEFTLNSRGENLTEPLLEGFLVGQTTGGESFLEFYKQEIDPKMKRGTKKEHTYTYNLFSEYRSSVQFDEVNLSLIQGFERFMKEKEFKQNTIYKHHKNINKFLRLASQKNKFLDSNNPYHFFKSKKGTSDRINLTIDEVKQIEDLKIDPLYNELIVTKDLFLFSCYTGLRFSDVVTLTKAHLINGSDGLAIYKKMEKVPKTVALPLSLMFEGKPKVILDKYLSNEDRIFPNISNQHINRQLKVLAQLAKVSMRLTFHISRHTFGSLMADISQNPYLIMDLMGIVTLKRV